MTFKELTMYPIAVSVYDAAMLVTLVGLILHQHHQYCAVIKR